MRKDSPPIAFVKGATDAGLSERGRRESMKTALKIFEWL